MALTHEEKERISEEEAVRHEARMRSHSHGFMHDGHCGLCGHRSGCSGCRLWAWLVAAVLLLGLSFCLGAWHHDGFLGHDHDRDRWMMDGNDRLPNANGMGDGGQPGMHRHGYKAPADKP